MTDRVWDAFLSPADRAALAGAPQAGRFGFGERPAVLSVDNYRVGFAGGAVERLAELLAAARSGGVDVLHVTGQPAEESGMAPWGAGRGGRWAVPTRYDIVPQAAPLPGEVVLRKAAPSAFFGTPLAAQLTARRVDTLVVCGQSTSGCVRATVVDACSHRFRVVVPEECVYDRYQATHAINLFDMNDKYADVLPLAEVLPRLTTGAERRGR